MDPMGEEQLDYGDDDYGSVPKKQHGQGGGGSGGRIPALAEEDDDEYDDLYNDVNLGEGFMQTIHHQPPTLSQPSSDGPRPPSITTQSMLEPAKTTTAPAHNPNFAHPAPTLPQAGPVATPSPAMNGPTTLFVGELHWWTTDADLESVLSRYGRVKEIKFFDERASGKSKGYCQVEFFDAVAAAACKEGMNGYMFNGRACVVTFASPQTLKQMNAAAYSNKNQGQGQVQGQGQGQGQGQRRVMNDGRGGWGRGQGAMNRGQSSGNVGPMRGRGNNAMRNMVGNGPGGPFGQGLGMMQPQGMMGGGFDPMFMGRGAPFGGFPGGAFPGMMPSFQAVNHVGLPGIAPHVNPAFFGRGIGANGMGMNGMGMMGGNTMDRQPVGMWGDPSMGSWNREDQGRTNESSYGGEDGASEYNYAEGNNEKGGRSNASRDKERERDWYPDEREQDSQRDRERYKGDRDSYRDHRQRDHDRDVEDDWDRRQHLLRSAGKSRLTRDDDYRSHSREADYGKRRRLPSE